MKRRFFSKLLTVSMLCFCFSAYCDPMVLTLQDAIQRSLLASPDLAIGEIGVDIKAAEIIQANLRPNPEFSIELNGTQFSRNAANDENGSELSYGISQEFEMGGKRSARTQLAVSYQQISYWDLELARYDIRQRVSEAFMHVMIAQERVKLAQEHKNVVEEILTYVIDQVNAGKQSPIQKKKAEMAVAARNVILKKEIRDFALAKQELSILWGCENPDFDGVFYPFYDIIAQSFPDFCEGLERHPIVAKWDSEIAAAYDSIDVEYAARVPDLTVMAGVDHDNDFEDTSLFFELSFPLPIFNRNQGNIARAFEQINLAEEKKLQALLDIKGEWKSASIEMQSAYEQALAFRDEVVQKAIDAFEATKEGFQEGKFPYIEVLEAQKTLFEHRESYVELLGEFHIKKNYVTIFFSF